MKKEKDVSKSISTLPESAGEYLLENMIQDIHTTLIGIRLLMQRLASGSALDQEQPQLDLLQQQLQQQWQLIQITLQLPSLRHGRSVICNAQLDDIEMMQKELSSAIGAILSSQATSAYVRAVIANTQLRPLVVASDQARHELALSDTSAQSNMATESASNSRDSNETSRQDELLQKIMSSSGDNFDELFSGSILTSPTTPSQTEAMQVPLAMVSFTQGHEKNLPQRVNAYLEVVREFLANSRLERIDLRNCEYKLALGQYLYHFVGAANDFGLRLMQVVSQPELIELQKRVDALELRRNSLMRDARLMPVSPMQRSVSTSHSHDAVSESVQRSSTSSTDSISKTYASESSQVSEHTEASHQRVPSPRSTASAKSTSQLHPDLRQPPAIAQPAEQRQRGFLSRLVRALARPFQALIERIFPNEDRAFLAQAHPVQPYQAVQPRASVTQSVIDNHASVQHPAPDANQTDDDGDGEASHITFGRR